MYRIFFLMSTFSMYVRGRGHGDGKEYIRRQKNVIRLRVARTMSLLFMIFFFFFFPRAL